jgi:hypothetical protein
MTLPKSIFDQLKEIDKFKESLHNNYFLKTIEEQKKHDLLYLKQLQATEIDKIKESLFSNSASKILEQLKNQELVHQKLLKDSLAIPDSTLQAINALSGRNNIHTVALKSLFRPPKLADSIFESATSKLFKELSRSPLSEFNKLSYPENLMDIMVGRSIQDFEKRYKNNLNISASEITSAFAISKMLGPVGVYAHYEEILKELKRQDNESTSDGKWGVFSREFVLSVFLSFLMFLYQEYSSNQMEQRINNKIDAKTQEVITQSSKEHNDLKVQIEQLELLIVNLSQTQQKPFTSTEYVVKDRSAIIREEPKNGSKVIAHIFPNQVVTIIDSEGKWIEVTYYDWVKRNYMNGWMLKKYLQRVKSK